MSDNLTVKQNDYAVFLPALSGFYATFVGKQRFSPYVDPARIPAHLQWGVEGMNWLNPKDNHFQYHWTLYSAGHANLDLNKQDPSEDMVRNRNRSSSLIVGDSGGFQIGKGVWEGDWKNPNCPKAQKKREQVLKWMDALMDYGMILDIPAWVARSPEGQKATGITTYEEACQATDINNEYFIANRTGACKFLNVLQGENHTEAEDWYQRMKKYCDPKQYPGRHFNGWAMGGQNMCDIDLALRRLVHIIHDDLLQEGLHDWMHFLGTSKLEWAVLLTTIQRAVRKYHNPNFTISFDCASPFLATANGQVYTNVVTEDISKWSYRMEAGADNKKYATDTRLFKDACVQDGIFNVFEDSPISSGLQIKDVCIYKPGDLNKVGKEGKTSWDSFSYALLMGHNVWTHINAVQEANRQYDSSRVPAMLIHPGVDKHYFSQVVDSIFAAPTRDQAIKIIDDNHDYWMKIIGTRGATGKKTMNTNDSWNSFFDIPVATELDDDAQLDESNLDNLEQSLL